MMNKIKIKAETRPKEEALDEDLIEDEIYKPPPPPKSYKNEPFQFFIPKKESPPKKRSYPPPTMSSLDDSELPSRRALYDNALASKIRNHTIKSSETDITKRLEQLKVSEPEPPSPEEIEKMEIHKENLEKLKKMKEEDILLEKENLLVSLDPELVEFLKTRTKRTNLPKIEPELEPVFDFPELEHLKNDLPEMDLFKSELPELELFESEGSENWLNFNVVETEKLEWMKDIEVQLKKLPPGTEFEARFDWNGILLPYCEEIPGQENPDLFLHGEDPERAGYTMVEFFRLARSSVLQQRIAAFTAINGILSIYNQGFYDNISELPISKIFFLLRYGLDDNIKPVIELTAKGLASLFYNEADEALLDAIFDSSEGTRQPISEMFSHLRLNDKTLIKIGEEKESETVAEESVLEKVTENPILVDEVSAIKIEVQPDEQIKDKESEITEKILIEDISAIKLDVKPVEKITENHILIDEISAIKLEETAEITKEKESEITIAVEKNLIDDISAIKIDEIKKEKISENHISIDEKSEQKIKEVEIKENNILAVDDKSTIKLIDQSDDVSNELKLENLKVTENDPTDDESTIKSEVPDPVEPEIRLSDQSDDETEESEDEITEKYVGETYGAEHSADEESEIEEETEKQRKLEEDISSDIILSEKNLIECLLRTNILSRIYYILHVIRPDNSTVISCIKILIQIARTGEANAEKIILETDLVDCLIENFLTELDLDESDFSTVYLHPQPLLIKLFRILAGYNSAMRLFLEDKNVFCFIKGYVYTRSDLDVSFFFVDLIWFEINFNFFFILD